MTTTTPRLYEIYNPDACPEGIPDTFYTLATSETAAAADYARLLESRGVSVADFARWNAADDRRWALRLAAGPDAAETVYIDPSIYGVRGHTGWTNRYTWAVALWLNNSPDAQTLAMTTARSADRPDNDGAAGLRSLVCGAWSRLVGRDTDALLDRLDHWAVGSLVDCIPDEDSWDLLSHDDRRALVVFMLDRIDWPAIVANLQEGDDDDTPADDDADATDPGAWDPDALAAALVARSWTQDAADEAAALLCAAFLSGDLHDLAAAILATVPAP